MSIDTETSLYSKSALEFKSTSFSVPILVIFNTDLVSLEHQIEQKIALAPEFFKDSPVLIDLQTCNQAGQTVDLAALITCLHKKKLFPVGLYGGNEEQNNLALEHNIPVRTLRGAHVVHKETSQHTNVKESQETNEQSSTETTSTSVENLLITRPIRSGQRIYAKGDLTVLSHVSAGAEIMAEGNIHIYGALRGRALAGVRGDTHSRIFCSELQAELVSIAGHYRISEDIAEEANKNPAQIYLKDQDLIIKKR